MECHAMRFIYHVLTHDLQDLASKKKLSGLTLPPLKDFCRRNHLSSNGKKADIIERIEQHFES